MAGADQHVERAVILPAATVYAGPNSIWNASSDDDQDCG